jgi:ketosteroid isomerase-like protein
MSKKISAPVTGISASLALMALAAVAQPVSAGEKVLYEDAHARLVEVTHWPGDKVTMAPLALPSIIAADAPWPELSAPPGTGGLVSGTHLPPGGKSYPWCQTQAEQKAYDVTVKGNFPQHYYRLEYKRIDGDGFAANWRTWYASMMQDIPKMLNPPPTMQSGAPLSADWPFPTAYAAVAAAPANHYLRYQDSHVELLEVFIRPGEKENLHGHPYSSVYFDDGGGFYPVIETTNEYMRPDSPGFRDTKGQVAPGLKYPTCYSANPQWVHSVTVTGQLPQHFYRMQFIRMDGDEIKTRGAALYPKPVAAPLTAVQRQLQELEQKRLTAMNTGDAKALGAVLADDYTHVHGTGHIDDKAGFIKAVVERPRETTRGPLNISVFGDTAVIRGEQTNRMVNADKSVTATTYVATQVARREKGTWKFLTMQATIKTAN